MFLSWAMQTREAGCYGKQVLLTFNLALKLYNSGMYYYPSFIPCAHISAHSVSAADDSFVFDCFTFDGYSSYFNIKDSSVFTGWML